MEYGNRDSSHYGASHSAREVSGWEVPVNTADQDNNPEIETLSGRARDLDRNNPLASNIRTTTKDNVIGTGLQLSPTPNWRVLGWTPEQANDWANQVKALWKDYSESHFFDSDGLSNFHLHTNLMHDSRFLNGSGIAIPMWKERPGTPYRTCFKIIESDRLCNPDHKEETSKLSGGVERRDDGEVFQYHIMNHHPGSTDVDAFPAWEKIPAFDEFGRRRFIHYFSQSRPGQSRGVSAAASVLATFGLQGKYQLTELQSAVVNSKVAGILETNLTDEQAVEMFGGSKEAYAELRKEWNGQLTAGSILKLPPGTTFKSHIPNRPAAAYAGFMDHVAREIGVGFFLPTELATRNFSETNYSSARAALLEAWRHFKVERMQIGFQWATPCVDLWMEDAVDLGKIEAPNFHEFRSAYTSCKWLAPGSPAIDRLKDEKAKTEALNNRTLTLRRVFEEEGLDWEEEMTQLFREEKMMQDLATQFGVELPQANAPKMMIEEPIEDN